MTTAKADLIEQLRRLQSQREKLMDELRRIDGTLNELIQKQVAPSSPGWYGCLESLKANVSAKDIDDARREMWGNFPRDIEP